MMQLLTASDVARLLSISKSAAYALMRHPELRTVKLGRLVRVDQRDLETFIEEQKRGGAGDDLPWTR